MKNIQTKTFTSEETLNEWLSNYKGEILDIKLQSEVVIGETWTHLIMVIYQN